MSNHLTCVDHKRRSLVLSNSQIHRDGTKCKSRYFILFDNEFTAEDVRSNGLLSAHPLYVDGINRHADTAASKLLTDTFTGG